jgi:Flp pilus assembly protein TadG
VHQKEFIVKRYSPSGQAFLEFALSLLVLLTLVMGTLDLGRAITVKMVLTNAAREGAYYLSTHPFDKDNCSGTCYLETIQNIQGEGSNLGIQIDPNDVSVTGCCTAGSPVEVTVSSSVNLTIIDIFYGPIVLTSSAKMMVQP